MKYLILLLSLISINAHAEYTKSDFLEDAATVSLIADWGTTLNIEDYADQGAYETNVIMGKHPTRNQIHAYFASVLVAHYLLNRHYSGTKQRDWLNMLTLGVEIGAVSNNYRLGLRMDF
jgi:hypothetical protein